MALSDMQVFNEQVQIVATETIDQEVQRFNEASGGTLIMGNRDVLGDYLEEASYGLIANLAQRRNAYGSGAVASAPIAEILDRAVKVDGRVGPIQWTPEQFRRLMKNEEEAGLVIGEQSAKAMIQDYLNTAASALTAATANVAALVFDGTAGNASLSSLNGGSALFGDRSQTLVAWLMHSKAFHDLIGEAINNTARLYTIGDINIMQDGLGRRFVVTDSPALITSGAPDTYHTVGLVAGGVQVQTGELFAESLPVLGDENIQRMWQGEYSFVVGLKGYAWDATNGGKSPTDAALGTGTNWDKYVTSDKDVAAVLVNTQ